MKKVILLLLLVPFLNCGKKDATPTPEEKRSADAAYNAAKVPGLGNIYFETDLLPGQEAQLAMKLVFGNDTLAAYASTDAQGRVAFISATVLTFNNGQHAYVCRINPATGSSRYYTTTGGVSDGLVLEERAFGNNNFEIAVLDETGGGEPEVLKSAYFNDGEKAAGYSAFRQQQGTDPWNCAQPQPAEDLDKTIDNHLQYHACGGLAWDSYPALSTIKNAFTEALDAIKSLDAYKPKLEKIQLLENARAKLSAVLKAVTGKLSGLKWESAALSGLLKSLEEQLRKLKAEPSLSLALVPAASDMNYDEVTDITAKFTYVVNDADTKLPFTKKPVFADFELMSASGNIVYKTAKASVPANGLLVFQIDPYTITNYKSYSSLKSRCTLVGGEGQQPLEHSLSLSYMEPKVVEMNGAPVLSTPFIVFNNVARDFKLVNKDNRQLYIHYSDVTIGEVGNSLVNHQLVPGDDGFSLKLSTNEKTDQSTHVTILYKGEQVAKLNFKLSVECDPAIVHAPVIGNITLACSDGTAGTLSFLVPFTADGPGILIDGSYSALCDASTTCYPVRLYFKSPGADWSIGHNSYNVKLISGTVNQGVLRVSMRYGLCVSGKTVAEGFQQQYPDFQWEIQLMNKCNMRSGRVKAL